MIKIKEMAHIVKVVKDVDLFYKGVNGVVAAMQDKGLTVEIQYQQSDQIFSALILGR